MPVPLTWCALCCQVVAEQAIKEREKEKEREQEKERELEAQRQQAKAADESAGADAQVCSFSDVPQLQQAPR